MERGTDCHFRERIHPSYLELGAKGWVSAQNRGVGTSGAIYSTYPRAFLEWVSCPMDQSLSSDSHLSPCSCIQQPGARANPTKS